MNAIEKSIELLNAFLKNGKKENLCEAHHLLGKFLDVCPSALNLNEKIRLSKCVDCGVEFERLSMNKVRCSSCAEKRKLQWQRDYYKRTK